MEENNKTKKLVITKDQELTDIISDILNTKESKIILTFAEESDILISPINLKVILETADDNDKLLLAQIIKNPSGIRNAKIAGLHTIDTPNTPVDEIWDEITKEKEDRLNPPKKSIQKEEVKEYIENDIPKSSDFEKRINDAIQKSRETKREIKHNKQDKNDDNFISFGDDLPTDIDKNIKQEPKEIRKPETSKIPDLSKVDFKNAPKVENQHATQLTKDNTVIKKEKTKFSLKNIKLPSFKKKSVDRNEIKSPTKFSKLTKYIPRIIVPLVVVALLSLFAYYKTAPFVKVKIYVQAKDVSIEEIFTGDENIKEIDFESKKIPVKKESVEKSRSTTTTATGTAYRGEKATGSVTFTYTKGGECTEGENISLPAGQVIVSSTGFSYKTDSATTISCNDMADASVQAIEVGEEYNISSGSYFTVQGYSSTQVYGLNSSNAFTGGSKEEYTVLSQQDVDSAVEELKKTAIEEGENELKEKDGSWTIIESSIKSDVVADSIKSDVPVGSEASNVNISLKTESNATYYFKDGFDEGLTSLLTDKANKENLFESDKDLELVLGENIEKDVSVAENTDTSVKIKLVASGSVKPKVEKDDIINNLKGKSWDEGVDYLTSLTYSEEPTEISFNPTSIPERFWYFPKKQGGVLITIVDVKE